MPNEGEITSPVQRLNETMLPVHIRAAGEFGIKDSATEVHTWEPSSSNEILLESTPVQKQELVAALTDPKLHKIFQHQGETYIVFKIADQLFVMPSGRIPELQQALRQERSGSSLVKKVEGLARKIFTPDQGQEPDNTSPQEQIRLPDNFPVGVASLASPHHLNHDSSATQSLTNAAGIRVHRYLVIDGAGGTAQMVALAERDRAIQAKMEAVRKKVCLHRGTIVEALLAADKTSKTTPELIDNDASGGVIAVEFNPKTGRLEFAWVGDPVAMTWSPTGYRHNRRVDAQSSTLEEPNTLQMISEQHNLAWQMKKSNPAFAPTIDLDLVSQANQIYTSVGGSKQKPALRPEQIGQLSIPINELDARFLLLMSDGARPNQMIAMNNESDHRSMEVRKLIGKFVEIFAQSLKDQQAQEDLLNRLTNIVTDMPSAYSVAVDQLLRHTGPASQTDQVEQVEQTEQKRISLEMTAHLITHLARRIGDQDDITVMIIDLNEYRPTA